MVTLPAYQTIGIVDIELGGEDFHNMFVERIDESKLLVESSRTFAPDQEYVIRFTLPVLDWVFEAKSRVETVELDPEEFNSENHYLLFHMLEMEDADREKLQEFIEMHKAGKTVIEDIQ